MTKAMAQPQQAIVAQYHAANVLIHVKSRNIAHEVVRIARAPDRQIQEEKNVLNIHIKDIAVIIPDIEEVVNVVDVQHQKTIVAEANQPNAVETMIVQENWLTINKSTTFLNCSVGNSFQFRIIVFQLYH